MALPKKGLRKITVDNFRYAWSATGNDDFISVSVAPLDNVGQLLSTAFDYHSKATAPLIREDGLLIGFAYEQQLTITPYIIRQLIQHALSVGWNPTAKGPQFNLRSVEDLLDLRLSDEH